MENEDFDKIVAVAGKPGLYFVVGQRPNGLIIQDVTDKSKKIATSARQKVSVLSDIAMFTEKEDVKLGDVFLAAKALEDKGETLPAKNADNNAIKSGFEKVLPDYDKDRVYTSDMKKMFGWYHLLKGNFDFSNINKEEEEDSKDSKVNAKSNKTKPKAKVPKNLNQKVKTKTGSTKISKASAPRKSS
jgi:hypothetical protein